jgi:hypothetical protein
MSPSCVVLLIALPPVRGAALNHATSPIATLPSWQLRQNFEGPCQLGLIVGNAVPPVVVVTSHENVFAESV